jgi:endoglycosylceramidase
MNEPFAGDIYKNPLLLWPGVADKEKLQPMYEEINEAIRAFDTRNLVLFQGVVWEVVLPVGEKYGFTQPPGGAQWANKSVLSFHNSVLPRITPDAEYYAWKQAEAQRLGVGLWVTETGGGQLTLLDDYRLSWMHWDYKWFSNLTYDNPGLFKTNGPFEPCVQRDSMDACLDRSAVPTWARTYPKAVAGSINSFTFNATTLLFTLSYEVDPACQLPTVVFASETWNYHNGFTVTIDPPSAAVYNYFPPDHAVITHISPVARRNITITLTPR